MTRMRLALSASLPALLLAACSAVQPQSAGPAVQDPASAGQCHADKVAWAVGQAASQEVMARVWKESGAGLIRPISPGQAVTRDFRPDRVNVDLDKDNTITRITCG